MSIPQDDIAETGMSDHDAVAALMSSMKAPAKGADADDQDEEDEDGDEAPIINEEDDEEGESQDDEDEEGDEGDEGSEEDNAAAEAAEAAAKAPAPVADDAVVKITVNGEETEFTVGSLKRLAGQEAALTQKSQEADLVGGRAAVALQGAIESVVEDLAPYEGVDWVLEGQRMDPEEFAWHRETFTRLKGRYDKLVGNAKSFQDTMAERATNATKERSAATVATLAKDVEGWSEELYEDVMKFGVAQGLDEKDVRRIDNAAVIKIIHQAMLFAKGKAAVAVKVKAAPSKVRKVGGRESVTPDASKAQTVFAKKAASGRVTDDDAMAALMGRWGVKGR